MPETRAPEETPARGAISVRMLVGAHAGQVVHVTREEAVRLCDGWQPMAEIVAVNRAETRETR
jgi:hypothetical protein